MAAADSSALWRLIEESQFWKHIEPTLERIVLDPKYRDALTLVKGMRNGIVYGTKVRFPHALVYVYLRSLELDSLYNKLQKGLQKRTDADSILE
jgi:hypothetical protein